MFEDEFDNIYRFFKTQTTVTIVPGRSAFNQAAAERLIKTLAPWGVKCEIMSLDEASKARSLSESEARTWVGLEYAGRGQVKPGSENSPVISGYAVQGAVILLGNPEDNDIIPAVRPEEGRAARARPRVSGVAARRRRAGAGIGHRHRIRRSRHE
jgi:hypothetical protein